MDTLVFTLATARNESGTVVGEAIYHNQHLVQSSTHGPLDTNETMELLQRVVDKFSCAAELHQLAVSGIMEQLLHSGWPKSFAELELINCE